jgi:GTP cyclohydrolase FolE2
MNLSDVIVKMFVKPKDKDATCPHAEAMIHIERMAREADKLLQPLEHKPHNQNL